ncbi:helix-turn-helix domain-containing protein [Actinomadura sp. 6N118]|uniref:helix-turn-helix domain-containing protein n=1 Tax=Actinomadura sp. 6N118 TaxID=3375151 RepID=UPI00379525A0
MQPIDFPPNMRLFKVEEAMELLSLGRNTIFEEMRLGRLRSVTVGRARRISGAAIIEYIENLERLALEERAA